MNHPGQHSGSAASELFLSGAYRRIQRLTIFLGFAAAIPALWFGWRTGIGVALGAFVGYVNFAWLHRASVMMVDRIAAPPGNQPSPFAILLAFGARYVFVIGMAYVILKGWPKLLAGFTVALFLPIVAAVGEGVYEAFASRSHTTGPEV